jgi:hypothetical protein
MKMWEYWGYSSWITGSSGQHYKMKFQRCFQHWDRYWSQPLNLKGDLPWRGKYWLVTKVSLKLLHCSNPQAVSSQPYIFVSTD